MFFLAALNLYCILFHCRPELRASLDTYMNRHSNQKLPIVVGDRTDWNNRLQADQPPKKPSETPLKTNVIEEDFPVVWINDGLLKGFEMMTIQGRKIHAFQNIPFAESPVGNLRFRAPLKNAPWKEMRDATGESPTCVQADFIKKYEIHGSEDCLYLNVYTPNLKREKRAQGLPVMVFIHAGGFFFGSSNLYGPSYLTTSEQDVVLVNINYRLGVLGFLSTGDEISPGNNGLKDQALALKWVQDNIDFFGGDPNRVTIIGESAGAGSVNYHMLSPLSKGLFHGGISQSGSAFCSWSISEDAVEITRKYALALNCSSTDSKALLTCLRKIDAKTLLLNQLGFLKWNIYPVVIFGPVIEPKHNGAFLDDLPENIYKRREVANVPWITGYNAKEGALNIATVIVDPATLTDFNEKWDFVGPQILDLTNSVEDPAETAKIIREHYMGDEPLSFESRHKAIDMFGDRYLMTCGVKSIRYHAAFVSKPVYAYQLSYTGSYGVVQLLHQKPKDWGPSHIDDLIYLVNGTYYPTLKTGDEEYEISKLMTSLWSNFAATGTPHINNEDSRYNFVWTSAGSKDRGTLRFLDINLQPKMINNPWEERISFWKELNIKEGSFSNSTRVQVTETSLSDIEENSIEL